MKLNQHHSSFLSFLLINSMFLLPLALKAQKGAGEEFAAVAKDISFSCVPDETIKGKMLLQWSATVEPSLSHFVLERSTDGKHFSDAAIIFAEDNAQNNTLYKFRDVKVASRSGKIFYRFRLVHASGEISYSKIWTYKVPKRQKEHVEYSS
jgi:hypothetical protein